MADTVRTIAEIQALLEDNTAGDISPQDLRDAVISLASINLQLFETGWKDLVMPLDVAGVPGANKPALTSFGPSGNREDLAFALNDYCFVAPLHVNHDMKPGGDAYIHVHWSTDGTSTTTVKWEFEITRAKGHGQEAFGAPTTITVEQAASGTAWQHMVAEVAGVDALTMTEPDELILVTLKRITNGGTNNGDMVYGLCVDFHYESDRHATVSKAPDFYTP